MSVTAKGVKEVRRPLTGLEKLGKDGNKAMMLDVKDTGIDIVLKRTASGRDVDGFSFKQYTDKYAKKKRSSFVDLFLSGKMLGSIKGDADGKRAVIAVEGDGKTYDIALTHNEGGTFGGGKMMPKREYFDIKLRAEIDRIREVFRKWIYKLVDRL